MAAGNYAFIKIMMALWKSGMLKGLADIAWLLNRGGFLAICLAACFFFTGCTSHSSQVNHILKPSSTILPPRITPTLYVHFSDGSGAVLPVERITTGPATALQFSPDGKWLFTAADGAVQTWEMRKGTFTSLFQGFDVHSLTYSQDTDLIAVAGGDFPQALVAVWNNKRYVRKWQQSVRRIIATSAAFSPDGTVLLCGSDADGYSPTVHMWQSQTGHLLFEGKTDQSVQTVCYFPNGKTFATGTGAGWQDDGVGLVQLLDVSTGKRYREMQNGGTVKSVTVSPNGKWVACGGYDTAHTVKIWDVATGRLRQTLAGATAGIESIAFSPDGTEIAEGGQDHTVRVWQVSTGRLIQTLIGPKNYIKCVAFSPNAAIIGGADADGRITFWDLRTGKCRLTLQFLLSRGNILMLTASDAFRRGPGKLGIEWLAYTPSGYYEASPNVRKEIRWLTSAGVRPDLHENRHWYRPHLLTTLLANSK